MIFFIGLDVVRTDRTLSFYEKKGNLAKLWDVLAVYAWLDKDIGYSQGDSIFMCDLFDIFGVNLLDHFSTIQE